MESKHYISCLELIKMLMILAFYLPRPRATIWSTFNLSYEQRILEQANTPIPIGAHSAFPAFIRRN